MKSRDDLFFLIKRLSPDEKAALTRHATNSSPSIAGKPPKEYAYKKLYNALEGIGEKEYEEQEFLRSPIGKPFERHFSAKKAELYEIILSVLRSRRKTGGCEKPKEFQIRELLEDAWQLKEKKLFEQSQKRLLKAKKEADKYQFHEVLLEILKLERILLVADPPFGFQEKLRDLHLEISEINSEIQNKFRLMALKDEVFVFVREHKELHGKFDRDALHRVMKEPELQNVSACLTFEAQSNYHFCHAIYHHLMENPHEAWIHARAQYLMWQEHKEVKKAKPVDYRNVLQNYISLSTNALRDDDFDEALRQLEAGPFRSDEEASSAIHNSINVRLQHALTMCQWERAEAVRKEYRQRLGEFSEGLIKSRVLTFYLSFSRLDMVKGDWKGAVRWAKLVQGEGGKDLREGLAFEAQLQETVSYFMQGDFEAASKKCRNILDNFRRWQQSDDFEKGVVTILKRLADCGQAEKAKQEFCRFLSKVKLRNASKRMEDSITHAWVRAIAGDTDLKSVLESDLALQLGKLRKG